MFNIGVMEFYLHSARYEQVERDEQVDMAAQHGLMTAYLKVLERRICRAQGESKL